jgi:hypothetical protein
MGARPCTTGASINARVTGGASDARGDAVARLARGAPNYPTMSLCLRVTVCAWLSRVLVRVLQCALWCTVHTSWCGCALLGCAASPRDAQGSLAELRHALSAEVRARPTRVGGGG